MHSSLAVANKVLELANRANDTVTPMQLIKLVYLCHGWMLGLHGRPMLNENVEAWRYGPVVRSLYDRVRKYRDMPVQGPLRSPFSLSEPHETFTPEEENIIQQVYANYGRHSGVALSNLTHQPGSPWSIVWNCEGKNSPISNDLIESHYRELYMRLSQGQQGQEAARSQAY